MAVRFLSAIGDNGSVMVAGHDIGGGVARNIFWSAGRGSPTLALANAVMYDSWPGWRARFRDPKVAAATSPADILAARRESVVEALARPASEAEIAEFLTPGPIHASRAPGWRSPAPPTIAIRSSFCPRCKSAKPKLLMWGEDDEFQNVDYAERYAPKSRKRGSSGSSRPAISPWKTTRRRWQKPWPNSLRAADDPKCRDSRRTFEPSIRLFRIRSTIRGQMHPRVLREALSSQFLSPSGVQSSDPLGQGALRAQGNLSTKSS